MYDKDCLKCLEDNLDGYLCYPFDYVRFHRGYTRKTMTFKIEIVSFSIGSPKWGAPKNERVFIIELGDKMNNNFCNFFCLYRICSYVEKCRLKDDYRINFVAYV